MEDLSILRGPLETDGWSCCSVASHVLLFATPWTPKYQASLSFTISQSLLKLMSIESVMPFNHLNLCHPLLLLPLIFPSIKVYLSQFFTSGGQSIGASATVLPMNIHGWFLLGLTGLISLLSKGLSRVSSSTTIWRLQVFVAQPSLWSNSHTDMWLLEKTYLWLDGPLLAKWYICFWIHCLGLS